MVIDCLVVRWPSGIVQTFKNVNSNQILTITEASVATAINNPFENKVRIYPNPASHRAYMELGNNGSILEKQTRVYDVNGAVTYKSVRQIGNNLYSLNVEGLSNGTYWLEVNTAKGIFRKKLIVLK